MTQVRITPSKAGQMVTSYKNKPKYGYLQLSSSEMRAEGGWLREEKRSALLRAEVTQLASFVKAFQDKNFEIPGKIHVREYMASAIPADVQKEFFNKDKSVEDNIKQFMKTTGGKDAIILTLGTEPICRFSQYDSSGEKEDCFVQHDNTDAIKAQGEKRRAAEKQAEADKAAATTGAPAGGK